LASSNGCKISHWESGRFGTGNGKELYPYGLGTIRYQPTKATQAARRRVIVTQSGTQSVSCLLGNQIPQPFQRFLFLGWTEPWSALQICETVVFE
jgi:hypothetical protein